MPVAVPLSLNQLSGAAVGVRPTSMIHGYSPASGNWMPIDVDAIAAIVTTTAASNDNLAGIQALITLTNQYVDALEALQTAGNADIALIKGYVDQIEGLIGTTNTKLDTLAGYTDGLETLTTALGTKLDQIIANTAPIGGLSAYSSALGLLSQGTIKNAPGSVYRIASNSNLSFQDGASTVWYHPGGTTMNFGRDPLVFTTNIKVTAIVASNVAVQFK